MDRPEAHQHALRDRLGAQVEAKEHDMQARLAELLRQATAASGSRFCTNARAAISSSENGFGSIGGGPAFFLRICDERISRASFNSIGERVAT